jgi:hypothetical protein
MFTDFDFNLKTDTTRKPGRKKETMEAKAKTMN